MLDHLAEDAPTPENIAEWLAILLGDDEEGMASEAAKQLGRFGDVALPALRVAAGDPRAEVRFHVARHGIRWMHAPGEAAQALALELMRDPDDDVRAQAALALCQAGPDVRRPFVLALRDLLDEGVRLGDRARVDAALNAIGHAGPSAGLAAPAVVAYIRQARHARISSRHPLAVDALGCTRSCRRDDVAALRDALDDAPAVAIGALGWYGSLAEPALDDVVPFLDHPDRAARAAAAGALARIRRDERALAILADLCDELDPGDPAGSRPPFLATYELGKVRRLPGWLLRRLEPHASDPERGVLGQARYFDPNPLLDDFGFDRDYRLATLAYLKGYGPLAIGVLPWLRAWAGSADPWLQLGAIDALAHIAPGDDEVGALAPLLGHERPEVRKGAVLAVDEFEHPPAWAARRVEPLMDDPDEDVATAARFVAAEAAARGSA